MNWNKAITVTFVVLFAGIGVYAGMFFLEMNRELTLLRGQERELQRRLEEARTKLAAQEKYLQQLQTDPQIVEEVIRRKLRYVRAQEFVFRFSDDATRPAGAETHAPTPRSP